MLDFVLQGTCGGDWVSGGWWEALWCPAAEPSGFGMAGVGMLLALGGFVSLYNWSDGLTLPVAWVAIIFGFVAATVPGEIVRVLLSVIVIGMALGMYALWRRSRR